MHSVCDVSDAHGFFRARLVDHEAGLREEAGFVAALDGFVDFAAAAEVVAGDDEMFQFCLSGGVTFIFFILFFFFFLF